LIGAHGDGIRILLDSRAHDVSYAAVVPQMNNLRTRALEEPADHIDGGIVPIEERCGAHEA
jgi:hypothetical protein